MASQTHLLRCCCHGRTSERATVEAKRQQREGLERSISETTIINRFQEFDTPFHFFRIPKRQSNSTFTHLIILIFFKAFLLLISLITALLAEKRGAHYMYQIRVTADVSLRQLNCVLKGNYIKSYFSLFSLTILVVLQ